MPTTIYKTPIPEATTPTERKGLGTRLAEQGVLGGDAIVDALSSESADLTLTGRYAFGRYYSELLASELEELANSTYEGVPLHGAGSRAGYYEVADASAEPVHAGGRDIWEWELSLTNKGTRKSHYQTVETAVSQPDPTHPFGNDTDALVGLPAAARQVRVLDTTSEPSERLQATPVATVATEFGDVDLYDATAEPIDDPVYRYDVAMDAQPAVDVRVYDTRGRDEKYIESDTGRVRAWQSVFSRDHEFSEGAFVLSSGRLRITIDEPTAADETATLQAETWDAGADTWSAVDLPSYADGEISTDWQPADVDLTRIAPARVAAQVEFEAVAGTKAGDVYAADVQLDRGHDRLFVMETSDGELPVDLEALLEPIAATTVLDSGAEQGLVAREEVRA